VLLPWLWSFSSLCARMSRPGSILEVKNRSIAIVLEVAVEQSLTIRFAVPLEDGRLDSTGMLTSFLPSVLLARLAHASGERVRFAASRAAAVFW
jgi:hypothetical protein